FFIFVKDKKIHMKNDNEIHGGSDESMYIIDGKCWKCHQPLKVAVINGPHIDKRGGTTAGPESFNEAELTLAKSKGVLIADQYSNIIGKTYLANTCTCGAFIGQHYLFTDYF